MNNKIINSLSGVSLSKTELSLAPSKISEKNIYDVYCNNYDSIHYLFIEFQFNWLQQAYKAMRDLDKYNILVYLYKENFSDLSEVFKFKSLNEFYINPRFNLDKINIIQISKKLRLSKETTRRKILELEEDGVLIKNKKVLASTIIKKLKNHGIGARPFFWPMNEQKIFKQMKIFGKKNYPNSKYLSRYGFYVPSYISIKKSEMDHVISTINKLI